VRGPAVAPGNVQRDPPLVLIVDDFEDARDMYAEYLAFKGYNVMTANSGGECIDAVRTHHPALILLDIRMPLMSGTDTMKMLRSNACLVDTPIVALTAYALDGERAKLLAAGFDAVIAKPCLPDELSIAIDRLLEKRRSPF
jgi:CheY-like chemotaxis protein